MATRSVRGSSSKYCMASLPETSARSPEEMELLTPTPCCTLTPWRIAPMEADWLKRPTLPAVGCTVVPVTVMRTSGSVLTRPSDAGPTTRMPLARASETSSRWAASPSAFS